MSRRAPTFDRSIRGDELEQQRAMLEHNLQHTDLSLHLSSHHDSELEFPRHAGVPSPPFSAFASFDYRSGDDLDPHDQSRFQAWSYHTDDGVHPYSGASLSTAAHHASALTISAGLGGGRGYRRDVSLSGAEYDPDRPLQGIVAGIAGRFAGLDANSTRSRQIVRPPPFYLALPLNPATRLQVLWTSTPSSSMTLRNSTVSFSQVMPQPLQSVLRALHPLPPGLTQLNHCHPLLKKTLDPVSPTPSAT